MGDMLREEGVGVRGASLSDPAVLTLQEMNGDYLFHT